MVPQTSGDLVPQITRSDLDNLNKQTEVYAYFSHRPLTDIEITSLKDPSTNNTEFVKNIEIGNNGNNGNTKNINYVYNLGNFFIATHPGGNKKSIFKENNWNGNLVLALNHGFDDALDRIINRAGGKLMGVLQTTLQNTTNEYPLGNIIGHLQTRDINNTWQTYYSQIPNQPILIVTYAQANLIPGQGFIKYNPDTEYTLKLNHFGTDNQDNQDNQDNKYITSILEAYKINNKVLTELGYKLDPEQENIDFDYIKNNAKTIYHYHGGTSDIIDNRQRLLQLTNTSIADISILPKPFGGSTSSIALVTGYRCADMI